MAKILKTSGFEKCDNKSKAFYKWWRTNFSGNFNCWLIYLVDLTPTKLRSDMILL